MERENVIAVNNRKEEYAEGFRGLSRDEYMEKLNKMINNENRLVNEGIENAENDYMNEVAYENNFGEENGFAERRDDLKDDFVDNYESERTSAKIRLIAMYKAVSERMESRTFADKFFHPFKTHQENKLFKDLKTLMRANDVTENAIEDYEVSNEELNENPIPIDEALGENETRTNIEVSLDDKLEKNNESFEEIDEVSVEVSELEP